MTRFIPAFALAVALIAPAHAEADHNTPEDNQLLTINPIDLVNGFLDLQYERAWNPVMSFHVGTEFLVWNGVWDDRPGSTFAVGPQLGVRFYPFASAPVLLWFGPFGGVAYVHSTSQDVVGRSLGGWVGGMIGVNGIIGGIFAISGGIGFAYHHLTADIDGSAHGLEGLWPRARLGLGVSF